MNFAHKLLIILFCFGCLSAKAVDIRQGLMHPDFASLQVAVEGRPWAPAVIVQGSPDRLTIEFDELASEARNLRWSVVHCDAQWQPEGLADIEFTDGLNEATVDDYDYSRATLTHYVHYRISLPDERVPLKLPGNYLLKVFEEYEPDSVLVQVRFAVCEGSVRVNTDISPRTDIDYLESHQQLDINLDIKGSAILNPYTDIKTVINQNGCDFNVVTLTAPSMVSSDIVNYSHLRPLIFDGGNEYRRFETVSTTYPGMGVYRMYHDADGYHALLYTDQPRGGTGYQYDQTQHGRFTVREYNSSNSDTEAEYILTTFTLESPKLDGADVYIEGELTGRRLDDGSRMKYNPIAGCYERTLLLKQGAYDYRYIAVPRRSGKPDMSYTEGNFCDTSNDYTVSVYYRRPGERFDRLAGIGNAVYINPRK